MMQDHFCGINETPRCKQPGVSYKTFYQLLQRVNPLVKIRSPQWAGINPEMIIFVWMTNTMTDAG